VDQLASAEFSFSSANFLSPLTFFLTGKLNKVVAFIGQTFILPFPRQLNEQHASVRPLLVATADTLLFKNVRYVAHCSEVQHSHPIQ